MTNREEIIKKINKLLFKMGHSVMPYIHNEYSIKIADYLISELGKAKQDAYIKGYEDACQDNPRRGNDYLKREREQAKKFYLPLPENETGWKTLIVDVELENGLIKKYSSLSLWDKTQAELFKHISKQGEV